MTWRREKTNATIGQWTRKPDDRVGQQSSLRIKRISEL